MSFSPYDGHPELAPDVTCTCGSVPAQSVYFKCAACSREFEVRCTSKEFWMWVRVTGEPVCTHCGVVADRTRWVPGRLHRTCATCGRDEIVRQGI